MEHTKIDDRIEWIRSRATVCGPETAAFIDRVVEDLAGRIREAHDAGTLDGFSGCLGMVHQHIRNLRSEYDGLDTPAVKALDRLYNHIAEDTK